jgi:tetratricopeptide (TPR) repeat protein
MNKLIGVSRWCSWSSAAGRAPMPTGIGAPSTTYGPAAINLADLYRQLGRDGDGESVLRAAIAASPQDAGLHHALGLALTRLKRRDESLGELRRAAELDRDRARYAYVYAVGLHSAGHVDEAMTVLKESLARHPGDRDTLLALVSFSRDAGDFGSALAYAEQLARAAPGDPSLVALNENLRRQIKNPDAR